MLPLLQLMLLPMVAAKNLSLDFFPLHLLLKFRAVPTLPSQLFRLIPSLVAPLPFALFPHLY